MTETTGVQPNINDLLAQLQQAAASQKAAPNPEAVAAVSPALAEKLQSNSATVEAPQVSAEQLANPQPSAPVDPSQALEEKSASYLKALSAVTPEDTQSVLGMANAFSSPFAGTPFAGLFGGMSLFDMMSPVTAMFTSSSLSIGEEGDARMKAATAALKDLQKAAEATLTEGFVDSALEAKPSETKPKNLRKAIEKEIILARTNNTKGLADSGLSAEEMQTKAGEIKAQIKKRLLETEGSNLRSAIIANAIVRHSLDSNDALQAAHKAVLSFDSKNKASEAMFSEENVGPMGKFMKPFMSLIPRLLGHAEKRSAAMDKAGEAFDREHAPAIFKDLGKELVSAADA